MGSHRQASEGAEVPDHQLSTPERRLRRQAPHRRRLAVLVTGASGVVGHPVVAVADKEMRWIRTP